MGIIKHNLSGRKLDLKYLFSEDRLIMLFDIDGETHTCDFNGILFFSLSNPNESIFPVIADSEIKIIDKDTCRSILLNKSFGYDVFDIPNQCFYCKIEGPLFLEIIAFAMNEGESRKN